MFSKLLTNSQQGFAQVLVILLLLAGVGLGTYLVQQQTQFFPQAKVCPEDEPDCSTTDEGDPTPTPDDESTPTPDDDPQLKISCVDKNPECHNGEVFEIKFCDGDPDPWKKTATGKKCGDQEQPKPSDEKIPGCNGPDCDKASDTQKKIDDCRAQDGTWTGSTCVGAKNATDKQKCENDKVTYCDGKKAIRKSGCYYDAAKTGDKCVCDFYAIPELDNQCTNGKNGDVVSEDPKKAAERDAERQRIANSGQGEALCPSETVCKNKVKVRKLSFPDPQNPSSCITETEVTDEPCYKRDSSGKILKDSSGAPVVAGEGEQLSTSEQTQADSLRAEQLKQKTELEKEFDRIAKENNDPALQAAIAEAKAKLAEAQADYDACIKETPDDPEYCRTRTALKIDAATLKARSTLYDAAAKGVPGVCVKSDFAVGSKAQNQLIEATPSNGQGGASRVFMCTTNEKYKVGADGKCVKDAADKCIKDPNGQVVIQYVVRDSAGNPSPISEADRARLGFQQNTTTIPDDIKNRRVRAQGASAPAAVASSIPSPDSPTHTKGATVWRYVDNSLCNNSCSDKQCTQYIPNYPSDKDIKYECMGTLRSREGNAQAGSTPETLKEVASKECNNLCTTSQKCMLGYISADQRRALPGVPRYDYSCYDKSTPEGYVTPADGSVAEGGICTKDKECAGGRKCDKVGGKDYGTCKTNTNTPSNPAAVLDGSACSPTIKCTGSNKNGKSTCVNGICQPAASTPTSSTTPKASTTAPTGLLADGANCSESPKCQSGVCYNRGLTQGRCQPRANSVANGGWCTDNVQCSGTSVNGKSTCVTFVCQPAKVPFVAPK